MDVFLVGYKIQENVWSEITEGIMNILFIHPVMFHPQRGGIERVSDLLCREFIRRGHNVLCLHNVRDESRMDYAYPASSYFFPYQVREVEKNGLFFRGFLLFLQRVQCGVAVILGTLGG